MVSNSHRKNNIFLLTLLYVIIIITIKCHSTNNQQTNTKPFNNPAAQTAPWFVVKQVADEVWRIDDHGGANTYLVVGDDKALLIDTGNGVADLVSEVKSITNLPVIVVNTHGHPDHVGGNFQFKEVYAHPMDFKLVEQFSSKDFHENTIKRTVKENPAYASELITTKDNYQLPQLIPVTNDYIFDLGNRRLKVIETPGHTLGSICLLDIDHKLLFTGDNCNTVVWMFLDGCLPLESYRDNLRTLRQQSDEFDTMFPGHGDPLEPAFLDELIQCAENILTGKCIGEKYETFVDYALVCSYKNARIAYDPNNLHFKD
ncbi:MBL fold metallo-hydrolase [candidate division KSB1 bacterium]|nr:MBL fold metallo-hydrolase [candidate division KSB1 bacterium]